MSRLIDADALHKYMFKSASERMSLSVEYMGGWNDAINYIASQTPTVDAVPVVHGRWIDETFKPYGLVFHQYRCNQCGDHAEYESPYCPNCGARMDEE